MADGASAKSLPKGVRIRAGAIQIYFERNKQAYNITLPHPPTAEGISAAAKIRSQLITKAEWGILTEKDIAEARGEKVDKKHLIINSNEVLFQEVAQKYLRQCEANLDTRKGYTRILNHHWMPHLALRPISQITNDEIRDLIIDKNFKTAKTLNNSLIPLRGVFEAAVNSKLILDSPMYGIENKRIQQAIPDPFSRAEMNALLKWLDKNLEGKNRLYYWFYELAFWCGCRPSELFALRWNDIDWFNGTMRISKSRVRGYEKSVTKTHTVRDVYLNDRSKRALTEIQKLGLSRDYVMICPETGLPFYDERPPRFRLNEAMKACKIRHRPAYNARHTYATMLLMDGVNPVFVADQMGHSLQMLMKRYAKWMHGDKNKIEMAKLNTS